MASKIDPGLYAAAPTNLDDVWYVQRDYDGTHWTFIGRKPPNVMVIHDVKDGNAPQAFIVGINDMIEGIRIAVTAEVDRLRREAEEAPGEA